MPLTPARILDTRNGTAAVRVRSPTTRPERSRPAAPAAYCPGLLHVTGNLTVTGQTSNGYLYIGPDRRRTIPTSSTLNFPVGDDRANGVTVALGTARHPERHLCRPGIRVPPRTSSST